jgi:flagellar biogenesis protein FliO
MKKNNRAQVTIFIIIAIIAVVAIILLYIFVIKPYIDASRIDNPTAFIQKCASDSIKD